MDIKALLNAPTLLAEIYRCWSKLCSRSPLGLQAEQPRPCPASVREGGEGCVEPSGPPHPTPSAGSPSPPKFPGSLCQGDISISPVSMATQRQVSARRMREPARATWGAPAHSAPTLSPHPRAGGATVREAHRTRGPRSARRRLQSAGHRWGAGCLCCGECLRCGRCARMWRGGAHSA